MKVLGGQIRRKKARTAPRIRCWHLVFISENGENVLNENRETFIVLDMQSPFHLTCHLASANNEF